MRAKDIQVPADYEVRGIWGPKRVTIVSVEKVASVTAYPRADWRDSLVWRAVTEDDGNYPLAAVLRPWAEAAPEYEAREAEQARANAAVDGLKDRLGLPGAGVSARVVKGYRDGQETRQTVVTITLTIEDAEALIERGM